jgi:hypothetical protein
LPAPPNNFFSKLLFKHISNRSELEEFMSTRGLTFLLSCLLVSSLSAIAQREGGTNGPVAGTGHSSTGTSSVANSNASFGASTTSIVTADQEGKIKFHTQTILVQVPVVVTDKSGNHIHGLAK